MEIYFNEQEKERTQLFLKEKKMTWEREQDMNAILAERKGETYERQPFPEISEKDALQCVRAGWKSELDLRFEKKAKKEGWNIK